MHPKLIELQAVVKKEMKKEKVLNALRDELFEAFGPPVMVSKIPSRVFDATNEHLDYIESSGRSISESVVRVSVLVEASNSDVVSARKLAARLLPEKFLRQLLNDTDSSVRCAAARRSPAKVIGEAVKRFPRDEALRTILREKRLDESGIPDPKPADPHLHMYDEKPMGDDAKTRVVDILTDDWYDLFAHKLCQMYGGNLERQWEEPAATRHVASHFSTTGVLMDREKLLNAIYKCLEARDDAVLKERSLRGIASKLLSESHMDDAAMPILEEETNPVRDLLESSLSSSEYIARSEEVFRVRKSYLPAGIKKYRLGEGRIEEMQVPMKATVPGSSIGPREERALDLYVRHWNDQQARRGEPFKLSWSQHPTGINIVGFNLELK